MNSVNRVFLDGILRVAGEWVVHSLKTTLSGVVSYVLSSSWFLLLVDWLKGGPCLREICDAGDAVVSQRVAQEVMLASFLVLLMGFICVLIWFFIVWLVRPISPEDALRFRRYWLLLAALLVTCGIAFDLSILPTGSYFHQIRILPGLPRAALLGSFVASAAIFFYVMSALRSPATVIAAVPFGSYMARIRWR